jgi:hypothetical protein
MFPNLSQLIDNRVWLLAVEGPGIFVASDSPSPRAGRSWSPVAPIFCHDPTLIDHRSSIIVY